MAIKMEKRGLRFARELEMSVFYEGIISTPGELIFLLKIIHLPGAGRGSVLKQARRF
jgi:hypothetical protein